jgi:hypothetical protein
MKKIYMLGLGIGFMKKGVLESYFAICGRE